MKGKVVVITGAGSGLGEALAQKYSKLGSHVCLLGRTKSKLQKVASSLQGTSSIYEVDVSSLVGVQKAMQTIVSKEGKIDCLVNNAGVGIFKSLEELSEEDIQKMININLTGTIFCTQAALSYMKAENSGQIINIVSASGKRAKATESVYSASKFGVRGFSEAIMDELTETGIKIFGVYMGNMKTSLWDEGVDQNILEEFMEPNDVAELIIENTKKQNKLYVQDLTILNHKQ